MSSETLATRRVPRAVLHSHLAVQCVCSALCTCCTAELSRPTHISAALLQLPPQMAKLLRSEALTEPEVEDLCRRATDILQREGNVRDVPAPCTVVGDIHGQLHDFIEILKIGGPPPDTNFVFMGDFVDRGYHSVECVSLVLTFKVRLWDQAAQPSHSTHVLFPTRQGLALLTPLARCYRCDGRTA